mmetsp:Transcript_4633/g.9313  ORF Transcript_4633/g.9313 Transcript_4633/m.9313 type:complete len:177 (+) Transcript_4633:139-669(+)
MLLARTSFPRVITPLRTTTTTLTSTILTRTLGSIPIVEVSLPSTSKQTNKPPFNVTKSAVTRLRAIMSNSADNHVHLRIGVDAGGCSGFQYEFDIEDNTQIDADIDIVQKVKDEGGEQEVTLVSDKDSLKYIRGSTVHFEQEMIGSKFVIMDNPQSDSACGCGSSFALKNFEQNRE